MKFAWSVSFVVLQCCPLLTFAHKEPTHQYIVREAYQLLCKQLGGPGNPVFIIPIMDDYIGNEEGRTDCENIHGCTGYEGKVVAGVWSEDHFDPIYYHHTEKILYQKPWVSASHFWAADQGNDFLTELNFEGFAKKTSENAFQKIRKYRDGGWEVQLDFEIQRGGGFVRFQRVVFTYSSLTELFRTGLIDVKRKLKYMVEEHNITTTYDKETDNSTDLVTIESAFELSSTDLSVRRGFVFNILGRMAHLLQDMSVPAHVHNTQHACPLDIFEEAMNLDNGSYGSVWNETNTFDSKGGLIDPFNGCSGDPVFFFMYTMNQIADHWASTKADGNDNVSTPLGEIVATISAADGITSAGDYYAPPLYTSSLYSCSNVPIVYSKTPIAPWDLLNDLRDISTSYIIRATAGLFYWFAREAGLLQNNCREDIYLQNQTFDKVYFFESGNLIRAGNNVNPSPSPQGDLIVSTNANVEFRAGNTINLRDGFRAIGPFRAFIQPCPNNCDDQDRIEDENDVPIAQHENKEIIVHPVYLAGKADDNIIATENIFLFTYPNPTDGDITISYAFAPNGRNTFRNI